MFRNREKSVHPLHDRLGKVRAVAEDLPFQAFLGVMAPSTLREKNRTCDKNRSGPCDAALCVCVWRVRLSASRGDSKWFP